MSNERNPELYRHSMEELRKRFRTDNYYVAIIKSGKFYYYDAKKQHNGLPLSYPLNASDPDDAWIFDFIKSGDDHTIKVFIE